MVRQKKNQIQERKNNLWLNYIDLLFAYYNHPPTGVKFPSWMQPRFAGKGEKAVAKGGK